jgi:hypothetical protein
LNENIKGLLAGGLSSVYAIKKMRASVSPETAFFIGIKPVVAV